MFAVASDVDRLLVEAVWAQWHPRLRRLEDLVRSGELGELTAVDSWFTFTSDDLEGNYRLDPTMGGGALLDVGGYQVHAWVALTGGADPLRIHRVDRTLGPTGVDLTTVASVDLGAAVRASMRCSFIESASQELAVSGTSASARCGNGEAFTTWREPSSLWVGDTEECFGAVDAFVVMTEAVSARVRGEEAWVVPSEQSIRTAEILDALRYAARTDPPRP
jgi:predicted dehydrogenase